MNRVVWAASVAAIAFGMVIILLALGAGASEGQGNSNVICKDRSVHGVYAIDGTCVTPETYTEMFPESDVDFYAYVATLWGQETAGKVKDLNRGGQYAPPEGCTKIEFKDGVATWVSTINGTVTVKAGTTSETYTVSVGDVVTHSTGKDLSHVILCERVSPTTTTVVSTTTSTSVAPTTTTTVTTTTSTTVPPVTTTSTVVKSTTTTRVPSCDETNPLWNPSSQTCELPLTGVDGDVLRGVFFVGLMALALGGVLALVGALIGRR